VDELHHRGVGQAYLYGDKATENYSKLHSFYLLLDRPSVCGLPDEPFNPWLNMAGDYARSMTGGLVAIAMLVVVLILSRL
jgi:formate dehydrogenase iron-sulfur subunit